MTDREPHVTREPHRILVVANRTCPCPDLHDEVTRHATDHDARVHVIAPALNSRLRHWVSDVDGALDGARGRLDAALTELTRRGADASGELGDSDPFLAIDDALATFAADEIIVSTHPPGSSNWLERDLVPRVRERHGLPVLHFVSEYGLEATEPAAAQIA